MKSIKKVGTKKRKTRFYSDGEKFNERREKYRVLQKVEALLNSYSLSEDTVDTDRKLAKDIVSTLM